MATFTDHTGMALKEVFERFAQRSPLSLIFPATAARVFSADFADRVFDEHALKEYERKTKFSTVVAIGWLVVCRD